MLQSMTGYGSATFENDLVSITAEVKTLNSKFTDTYCRIPKSYSSKEVEIRNLLTKEFSRGKIEFNLQVNPKDASNVGTSINKSIVKAYIKDLQATADELGFKGDQNEFLKIACTMPNVFEANSPSEEEAESEWSMILNVIKEAIATCIEFRIQEGEATKKMFSQYINNIGEGLEKVILQDPNRIPAVRERLEKSMADFIENENFDKNRFEQELIYYVEKYDISEEKVRLKNHLEYFEKELEKESNGKRLNFITQEIGREINTIGSKANDAVIQRLVVEMKDELEKIKEQTMNVV